MKQYFRYSLRTMMLAITVWSVLLLGFVRLGLVEALEILMLGTGLLVLWTYLHREVFQRRQQAVAVWILVHVFATPAMLIFAHLGTRAVATWWGVAGWAVAGVLMFPLALLHHFVCRYCHWYWGLSQPGTFFLIVVLNALLWVEVYRWWKRRPVGAAASAVTSNVADVPTAKSPLE